LALPAFLTLRTDMLGPLNWTVEVEVVDGTTCWTARNDLFQGDAVELAVVDDEAPVLPNLT
jgi:hypothetical protein